MAFLIAEKSRKPQVLFSAAGHPAPVLKISYFKIGGKSMRFNQKDFGQRVRSQRRALHMTQRELAGEIFADAQHVGRIERGEKSASIELLIELSEALSVSTDYLLMGKKNKSGIRVQLMAVIEQLSEIAQKL